MEPLFRIDTKHKRALVAVDKLQAYIPKRFERYGLLSVVDNVVVSVGIFDIIINDKIETGLLLPAELRMKPSSTETQFIGADEFLVLTFVKGDVFCNTEIVRNQSIGYAVFNEFVYMGRLPRFLQYQDAPLLFDRTGDVCKINFGVDHAIIEILFAFLFRDDKDTNIQYRYTPMTSPPNFVSLSHGAQLAVSTLSKLSGPYFDDALNSALINQTDEPTELEEILIQ